MYSRRTNLFPVASQYGDRTEQDTLLLGVVEAWMSFVALIVVVLSHVGNGLLQDVLLRAKDPSSSMLEDNSSLKLCKFSVRRAPDGDLRCAPMLRVCQVSDGMLSTGARRAPTSFMMEIHRSFSGRSRIGSSISMAISSMPTMT